MTRLIDADELRTYIDGYIERRKLSEHDRIVFEGFKGIIDNAPTVHHQNCETCEDKAKQYSLGLKDGYLLGGFQLAELRRWLLAQGYSEGTVEDKIEDFGRFVKRVREDEG